jgi:hypothetical protein
MEMEVLELEKKVRELRGEVGEEIKTSSRSSRHGLFGGVFELPLPRSAQKRTKKKSQGKK